MPTLAQDLAVPLFEGSKFIGPNWARRGFCPICRRLAYHVVLTLHFTT